MNSTRRRFLRNSALVGAAGSIGPHLAMATADKPAPFRTPYKFPKLVLSATHRKGDFDQRSIDDPIVFYAKGAFQMLYIGWDGIGYQTGLATSDDLLHWTRTALVAPRNPAAKYTKYRSRSQLHTSRQAATVPRRSDQGRRKIHRSLERISQRRL